VEELPSKTRYWRKDRRKNVRDRKKKRRLQQLPYDLKGIKQPEL